MIIRPPSLRCRNNTRQLLTVLGTFLALAMSSKAGSRRFSYSYETTPMAKGEIELESWFTFKDNMGSDPDFKRLEFRHEIEYGFSDRLQLALYFADWRYEENADTSGDTEFHDVAVEAIYSLTNPNTSAIGSALYGEIKGSDDFVELEAKLLLQKNMGPWTFVYNIGGEIAWEDDYQNDEAELMQSAGIAYELSPSWSVGAEVLHEIAVPDVEILGDSGVYLGPNIAWRHHNFAAAVTALWQLTSLEDEPDLQLRTIFSISF